MKNLFTGFIALLILIIIFFQRKSETLPHDQSVRAAGSDISRTARCLMLSDKYLDIDTNLIYHLSTAPDTEKIKVKAVVWRFFKHVTIRDSIYVTDLTSGKEINISESDYHFLSRNMLELNRGIMASRARGEDIDPAAIGNQYLSSLSD
ncbi:hypothetical protein MTO98_25480 [Mucilaginibacter sp. SMC90]|uniref:hypothetical protein n=1 Tax=Mucilaginibacter sp. SMC90 TaxID=2929803 RepID=UPI001FB21AE9|nr:hypothetical protein [Mucilaginibacter sp. SMC90]UOE47767.1 hypothetical protein MTO98_25480 [Mucilaginibacter sp. SMC90]